METTTRTAEARAALAAVERARTIAARHSQNNGTLLLVWGGAFLADMVAFDASRLLGTVWLAVALVIALNSGVLLWKVWYERRLLVRPLTILFDRVIVWWAWYHVVLVGLGVGAWAIFVGRFPPFWLTGIGIVGALPLFLLGVRQRRQSRGQVEQ